MTGGQALVRSLRREGIRTVFGIPGAGQYEIVDALWEADDVNYVSVRHEQATTYMADGYFRATGEPAGVVVVQGPGFFNTTAGLATAYDASSPMLVVTGTHLYSHDADTGDSHWLMPLAKWQARADRPADLPELVSEAVAEMRNGRPRPALLQVGQPALAFQEDVDLFEPEEHEPPTPDSDEIERAALVSSPGRVPPLSGPGAECTSPRHPAVSRGWPSTCRRPS